MKSIRSIKKILAYVIFVVGCSSASWAASSYLETFDGDLGGWISGGGVLSLTHQPVGGNPGGVLQARISPTFPNPPPLSVFFSAGGDDRTAALTGDYLAARVLLFGFDAWSSVANNSPQGLTLRLWGDSGLTMVRDVPSPFPASNTWYTYRFALQPGQLGGWYDDVDQAGELLANVTNVVFNLKIANGSNGETYRFDNIFLDALPSLDAEVSGTGIFQLSWENLRTNEVYRLEECTSLLDPVWTTIGTVTAETSTVITEFALTNQWHYFRMVME
jgi:hypothetical protein